VKTNDNIETREAGKAGWILRWLLGVPIPAGPADFLSLARMRLTG